MVKNLFLVALTLAITFLSSFAEKPIAVFYEKNGAVSYEELTRNVLINSQNETTVTENFNRSYAKKDWSSYANQALVLGSLNYRSNQKSNAIDFFKNAVTGFERSGSAEGQAMAHCAIGLVYQSSNQLDSAVEHYKRSIQLNHQANNYTGETKVRVLLSKVFEEREEHDSSLRNFKEALDILPK